MQKQQKKNKKREKSVVVTGTVPGERSTPEKRQWCAIFGKRWVSESASRQCANERQWRTKEWVDYIKGENVSAQIRHKSSSVAKWSEVRKQQITVK